MAKQPSSETALRTVRRELTERIRELNTLKVELSHYRGRASKAEAEVSEWKRRFDLLLARTPKCDEPLPCISKSPGVL